MQRTVIKNMGSRGVEERGRNGTRMAFSRLVYPIILRFSHYPVVSPFRGPQFIIFPLSLSLSAPLSFPRPSPVFDDVFFPLLAAIEKRRIGRGREGSLPRCATGVDEEIQVLLG